MAVFPSGGCSVSAGVITTCLSPSIGWPRLIHMTQSYSAKGHTYRNGKNLGSTFCNLPHPFSFHFSFSHHLFSNTERTWFLLAALLVAFPITGFLRLFDQGCVKRTTTMHLALMVVQYLIDLCVCGSSGQV